MAKLPLILAIYAWGCPARAADSTLREQVARKIDAEYPALEAIYQDRHQHPELAFTEVRTAALVAGELRALGFEVAEKVGNTGVVGVMRNGAGPTVLVRADMDALPMEEKTGLPYASRDRVKDLAGKETPAMHACAHDAHVTALIGTARVLTALKDHWAGTLVLIDQPAEEIGAGATAMLRDGLFTRFPRPDYALALHVGGDLPAGFIGYVEGPTHGEDFSAYSRVEPKIPACIFWVGGSDPAKLREGRRAATLVPSNHSPLFAPVPEPALKAAVTAMSAAVLELVAKR